MDAATKSKDRLNYARVMIEVGIQGQLPDNIQFYNEHGVLLTQKVEYEWRPIQCAKCQGFGHETEMCRKKEGSKRWVKKATQVIDQAGFIKVNAQRVTNESNTVEVPVHNTFLPLEEEVEIDKLENALEDKGCAVTETDGDIIGVDNEGMECRKDSNC